jgi:hypothetical protein
LTAVSSFIFVPIVSGASGTVTYSLDNNPDGKFTIDAVSGSLSAPALPSGTYNDIKITATDSKGNKISIVFTFKCNSWSLKRDIPQK